MRVQIVAHTEFMPPADIPWTTDGEGGAALVEFAGRACYESWDKPRPATATNSGFIAHIIDVGHLSLLEHASVTMYVTGISRSVAHELIRHRHFSVTQLSPRTVQTGDGSVVVPPGELGARIAEFARGAQREYDEIVGQFAGKASPREAKRVRQLAQTLLPGAQETRLVVTGNFRAWRHFIAMHAADQVDDELRMLAVDCLRQLHRTSAAAFDDFVISELPGGVVIATSALVRDE